jgi:hypothetical protein
MEASGAPRPNDDSSMPPLYLIDGFNFLHAVVLRGRDRARWWCAENQRAVCDWVAEHPVASTCPWIIFDQRGSGSAGESQAPAESPVSGLDVAGPAQAALPGRHDRVGAPEVRYAPDADAYILACCGELRGLREVVVVSADRSLVDRAKRLGARALSPWVYARYAGGVAPTGGDAARGP